MLTEFHVSCVRVLLSSYASSGSHAELCVRAKSPLQRREENTDANRQQAVNTKHCIVNTNNQKVFEAHALNEKEVTTLCYATKLLMNLGALQSTLIAPNKKCEHERKRKLVQRK